MTAASPSARPEPVEGHAWTPLAGLPRRALPGHAGPGIYVFRDRETHEVLYIGQSGNVRRRLRDYYDGGVSTRGRIHRLLYVDGWADRVEVRTAPTPTPAFAELHLLNEHRVQYGAPPAWNIRKPSP